MSLPTNPTERKAVPIATGFVDYFPDAIAAVAHLSWVGNQQHNPGEPLHWAKDKSTERIDGIVALIMAIGRAMVTQEQFVEGPMAIWV